VADFVSIWDDVHPSPHVRVWTRALMLGSGSGSWREEKEGRTASQYCPDRHPTETFPALPNVL
jgi:hypothetical protein